MSRIRTVKPELFKHLGLYEVEEESSLPIRLAFISLLTVADRRGIFEWIPRQLKTDCLPYDDVDFSRVLDALATRDFVRKYIIDEREYGFIPGFTDHQFINGKEKQSLLPPPPEIEGCTRASRVDDALPTGNEHDENACSKERKGKEGKSGAFVPPSLEEAKEYIQSQGYVINAEDFINFYASKGWMVGENKMKCWHSAMGGWNSNEKKNPANNAPQIGGR